MTRLYIHRQFALAEHLANNDAQPFMAALVLYNLLLRRGKDPHERAADGADGERDEKHNKDRKDSSNISRSTAPAGVDSQLPIAVPVASASSFPTEAANMQQQQQQQQQTARQPPPEHADVLRPCFPAAWRREEALARVRAAELLLWSEHACCPSVESPPSSRRAHRQPSREVNDALSRPPHGEEKTREEGKEQPRHASDTEKENEEEEESSAASKPSRIEGFTATSTRRTEEPYRIRAPMSRLASQECAELAYHLLAPLFIDNSTSAAVTAAAAASTGLSHGSPLASTMAAAVQCSEYFFSSARVRTTVTDCLPSESFLIRFASETAEAQELTHTETDNGSSNGGGGGNGILALFTSSTRRVRCESEHQATSPLSHSVWGDARSGRREAAGDSSEDAGKQEMVSAFCVLKAFILLSLVARRGPRPLASLRRTTTILTSAEAWLVALRSPASMKAAEQHLLQALQRRFLCFLVNEGRQVRVESSDNINNSTNNREAVSALIRACQRSEKDFRVFLDHLQQHERRLSPHPWYTRVKGVFEASVRQSLCLYEALLHAELSRVHSATASHLLQQGIGSLGALLAAASPLLHGSHNEHSSGLHGVFSASTIVGGGARTPAPHELKARLRELTDCVRGVSTYANAFAAVRDALLAGAWQLQRGNASFSASSAADCLYVCEEGSCAIAVPCEQHEQQRQQRCQQLRGLLVACAESLAFFRVHGFLLELETGIDCSPLPAPVEATTRNVGDTGEVMLSLAQHLDQCVCLFAHTAADRPAQLPQQWKENNENEFALLQQLLLVTDSINGTLVSPPSSSFSVTSPVNMQPALSLSSSWSSPGLRAVMSRYVALRQLVEAGGHVKSGKDAAVKPQQEEMPVVKQEPIAHEEEVEGRRKRAKEGGTTSSGHSGSAVASFASVVPFYGPVVEVGRQLSQLLSSIDEELLFLGGQAKKSTGQRDLKRERNTDEGEDKESGEGASSHGMTVWPHHAQQHAVLFCTPHTQIRVIIQVKSAALLSAASFALTNTHYISCVHHLSELVHFLKVFARYFSSHAHGNSSSSNRNGNSGGGRGSLPSSLYPSGAKSSSSSSTPTSLVAGGGSAANSRMKVELHLLIASLAMHFAIRDVTPALRRARQARAHSSFHHQQHGDINGEEGGGEEEESNVHLAAHGGSVSEVMLDVGLPYLHLQAAEELYYSSLASVSLHGSIFTAGTTLSGKSDSNSNSGHGPKVSPLLLLIKLMKAVAMYQVAASGEKTVLHGTHSHTHSGSSKAASATANGTEEDVKGGEQRSFTMMPVAPSQRHRCSAAVGEVLEKLSETYATDVATASKHSAASSSSEAGLPLLPVCWTRSNVALLFLLQALYALTESKDEVSFAFYTRRFLKLAKAGLGVRNVFVADTLQLLSAALHQYEQLRCRGGAGHGQLNNSNHNGDSAEEEVKEATDGLSPEAREELQKADMLALQVAQRLNGLALYRHYECAVMENPSVESLDNNSNNGDCISSSAVLEKRWRKQRHERRAYEGMKQWWRLQLEVLSGGSILGASHHAEERNSSSTEVVKKKQLFAGVLSCLEAASPASSSSSPSVSFHSAAFVQSLPTQFLGVLSFLPHTPAYRKLEE